ncbi:putative site-specific recombinase [Solidesulfovibrio fructosivorans JJ]]|uniref:Putative site-specific recombinase n=2 Tax=Solidesulfovibrio fructosivorans TaxID=878 RepID=E1JXE6_SOLFR|nr:putative site-specific recombinase [Solidesulfovibrio fructosivorans JJ]]
MGHASVKMTVDQYYHLLGGEKRRTIAKLPSLTKSENMQTTSVAELP